MDSLWYAYVVDLNFGDLFVPLEGLNSRKVAQTIETKQRSKKGL